MQFRLPKQLKEKITIVRRSAFERKDETIIATDVVCMIIPQKDINQIIDGVGISDIEWVALLEKPIDDISEGDIIRRTNDTEMQIRRVRALGTILQLVLKEEDIVV